MKKTILSISFAAATLFAGEFTLYSDDLAGQLTKTQEANSFGCNGSNISPELHWKNAPKGTKSFAVTVYDPDAPTGSGWWHWVVFDIPTSVHALPSDFGNASKKQQISAIQSKTDTGSSGFLGACPPKGDKPHRYIFTVHALNTERLGVDATATPALVGFMLNTHTIGKATLVSYYGRQ